MATHFVKGQIVEWSAGDFAQLYCGDVIEDGMVTYAILFDSVNQRYAAAFEMDGDENDGWYFVNDDENTFKVHRYLALAQIVIAMKETADM